MKGRRVVPCRRAVISTYWAVVKERADAAKRAAWAQVQEEARKAEYQEFLREAERGEERTA